jgi:UDP-glucose 4-epimerase
MKRILVTGAGGFIAGHLIPHLAGAGAAVVAASRSDLAFRHPAVTAARLPASQAEWAALLSGVDAVVHLAGLAHRVVTPEEHERVNHGLAADAALASARAGIGHFIFVSSIAAQVGPSAPHVITEADTPHPAGAYGAAKLAAEKAVAAAGVPFTILRPVVVEGAGAKGNAALLDRIARLPLPLPFGALTSRRSVLSIGNFNTAVDTVLFNPAAFGETFVVADPEAPTVAEIVAKARRRHGRAPGLFKVDPRLLHFALRLIGRGVLWSRFGEPLVVDPAKLLALGWKPT